MGIVSLILPFHNPPQSRQYETREQMHCQGRYLRPSTLEIKVLGFECVKEMYAKDDDFKEILKKCSKHAYGLFHLENGFLFKGTRLCIPKSGFRVLLIQEPH